MQPVCNPGCTMSLGSCLCSCPANTEPATEDPTRCVPTTTCETYAAAVAAQLGISLSGALLTTDSAFSLLCMKTAQVKILTCPTGFSEWQTGFCYLNCPAPLQESGVFCVKKSVARAVDDPVCNSWIYSYNGTSCALSSFFVIGCILLFFVFYLLVSHGPAGSYSRR